MEMTVMIEETIAGAFVLDIPEGSDPLKYAQQLYFEGKLVVEAENITSRQIAVVAPVTEATEWIEF